MEKFLEHERRLTVAEDRTIANEQRLDKVEAKQTVLENSQPLLKCLLHVKATLKTM